MSKRKVVKAPAKHVDKSERKSGATLFRKGPDPRRGRGPKKGAPNAGRPRNEHVLWCQRAISDPKAEAEVRAVLKDRNHPAFATMWKALTDRGYGKPTQPLEHTGPDGAPLPPAVIQVALVRP